MTRRGAIVAAYLALIAKPLKAQSCKTVQVMVDLAPPPHEAGCADYALTVKLGAEEINLTAEQVMQALRS